MPDRPPPGPTEDRDPAPPTATPSDAEHWKVQAWPEPAERPPGGGHAFQINAAEPILLPHTEAGLVSFHSDIPGVTAWGWLAEKGAWERINLPGLLFPRHSHLAFLPPATLSTASAIPVTCFLEWCSWEIVEGWFERLRVRTWPPSILDDLYSGPRVVLGCGEKTVTVYERDDREAELTIPHSVPFEDVKPRIDRARGEIMDMAKNIANRRLAATMEQVIPMSQNPNDCMCVGRVGDTSYRIDVDDTNVRADSDNMYVDIYVGVTAHAPLTIRCVC